MRKSIPELENSVLIVAHPDDEVLWFGSLLAEIDLVVIVFLDYHPVPDLGRKRLGAIAELPFKVSPMGIAEACTYGQADWHSPEISRYGLQLGESPSSRAVATVYQQNFELIESILREKLKPGMNVFTHNPWGEYGHEDHVQVSRVIEHLAVETGFTMYVSGYQSSRSRNLANQFSGIEPTRSFSRDIDSSAVNRIADIYKKHGCWTWADDWYWHDTEYFHICPVYRHAGRSASTSLSEMPLCKIPASVHDRLPGRSSSVDTGAA